MESNHESASDRDAPGQREQQQAQGQETELHDDEHQAEVTPSDRSEVPELEDFDDDSPSLDEELGRLRDALLRTRAEMDNLHKRTERDIEKSRKYAAESLLKDLVPVIDSLDQGIEACAEEGGEGLKLTRKLLLDTLTRHGLEPIDPAGQKFDPQWHEAMTVQSGTGHPADMIVQVLQRGYRLHDRVIRAARVIVSSGQ